MSEQLFDRLMELGRAYRLHVMTLLAESPRHEPAWINGQQAEALVEEVEFLRDLAAPDTALTEIVAALLPLIVEAARYGDRNALVVDGP